MLPTRAIRRSARPIIAAVLVLYSTVVALAANPRWVTGPPYFTTSAQPVIWYTDSPKYFTDPGDLSSTVNHAAADAIVAAAAAVWNIPTDRLTLAQGGTLTEHISASNTYVGPSGIVFPSDAQASNSAAIQIAIIYDRDGSITDLLLGAGASDPSGCRDSAVTESVDSITPDGYIHHAILVLNGRCTGTDPAMQTQMQYQLMRAFGRVLGLGWSQANDNVFTGSPTPTPQQALHWPLMHPIDILCGLYSYQCLPQPFTPRMDDISSMASLYFIAQGQAGPGKIDSLLAASQSSGQLTFPDGQGMQGVNVVVRRFPGAAPITAIEPWDSVSSVSGYLYRQKSSNAIMSADNSALGSMGATAGYYEGLYNIGRVDLIYGGGWQFLIISTEPVNPLYTGQYSVGPYVANTVQPSGGNQSVQWGLYASYNQVGWADIPVPAGAGSTCSGSGGTESVPQSVDSSGWWQGQLCGYGWTSWLSLNVQANRTFTIEATAEDEQGFATTNKSMPVIGVWRGSDPLGSSPTVAAVTEGLNTPAAGLTSLQVDNAPAGGLRIAIADQRGDGRPDYNLGGRILYADSIYPASLPRAGGPVTINGMGFRPGNTVTINGVAATVQSWTSNTIIAIAPAANAIASGSNALVADVAVHDISSGGTTTMLQALTYSAASAETMQIVSAPSGAISTGVAAATSFSIKVLASDGVTPVAGETITFTASTSGSASMAIFSCGTGACTAITDTTGVATTTITPLLPGLVTLTATGHASSQTAVFTAIAPVKAITLATPNFYLSAGATLSWTQQATLSDSAASVAGLTVNWTGAPGLAIAAPTSTTNSSGVTSIGITSGPLASGAPAIATACSWSNSLCANFTVQSVNPSALQLQIISGSGQSLPVTGTLDAVLIQVTDASGHPVAGAPVSIYQTLEPGAACPTRGRCPTQPIERQSQSTATSDVNGLVTITPLDTSNTAEVTNIAVAAGTQGFISLSLTKGW